VAARSRGYTITSLFVTGDSQHFYVPLSPEALHISDPIGHLPKTEQSILKDGFIHWLLPHLLATY
jgi:hypothetical protein